MEDETKEKQTIRSYLLGDLAEGEMRAVEERIMTDNEFSDLALTVESMLVDDYIEGALEARDRERFERRFLSTPQGREQVRFTLTLKEYATQSTQSESVITLPRRSFFTAHGWKLAAAAIFLIALGFVVWRAFIYQPEIDKGLAALNRAYIEQRPVSCRITGFDYAPAPVTRGEEQEKADKISLRRAEIILLKEVATNPGPRSHNALGRYHLARRDFDKAIAEFTESLRSEPDNAQAHSDLGAALLERGKLAKQSQETERAREDFRRSLEHLNRALERQQGFEEAIFNRALALQEAGFDSQAEEEWKRYLEKDSRSRWADEARQFLKQLEERKNKSSNERDSR
ncbi:MAG: tetratricopeptide repeat protein [Acidobacteriota bacterium]